MRSVNCLREKLSDISRPVVDCVAFSGMPSVKRGWTFSLRKISSLALPGFNPGESFGDRLGIGRRQDPSPKACGHIAVSNEIHGVVMTTRRAKKAVAQQLQGRRLGSQE